MAELKREIEEADIPQIKELVAKVRGDEEIKDITRLGGLTNHSYKITLASGEELLVRIPGEGTEEMIVRTDEEKSTRLACKLGIDAELFYFDAQGHKVMRFINSNEKISAEALLRSENLKQVAEIFHKLHTCGEDTGVRFEVFEMADLYEKIIRDGGVKFYDDYEEVKQTVMDIKAAVDKDGEQPRVPCHCDSLVDNWVIDTTGKVFLIDWEYSGMNEAMWDLSCFSIETDASADKDDELLSYYYGREADVDEKKKFIAAKLYVDYLWTLWGLTRVPFDGDFMQQYADDRYVRLKKNIEAYKAV